MRALVIALAAVTAPAASAAPFEPPSAVEVTRIKRTGKLGRSRSVRKELKGSGALSVARDGRRSTRGFVAWVEGGDDVRASWFTGGHNRSCR
jgi:hypothetical protein